MKIKTVVSATAAILYGMGTAAAALDASTVPTNVLKGVELPPEVLNRIQKPERENSQAMSAAEQYIDSQKVNRHIMDGKPRQKFVLEQGLVGEQTYIVRLKDAPVATYDGRLSNYAATNVMTVAAADGNVSTPSKLYSQENANLSAVESYKSYLYSQQEAVANKAASLGLNLEIREQYTNALNAFSVRLTQDEAQRLASLADVVQISRSTNKQLFTDVGPGHIGADRVWSGEVTDSVPFKGEGMVIGIIDTGVNTDHASFAEVAEDGYVHINPWGDGVYAGDCLLEGFESMCNNKLIGVRSYPVITDMYDSDEVQDPDKFEWDPNELIAPKVGEDFNGHGSHVAGTAAGNPISNQPMLVSYPGEPDGVAVDHVFPMVSGVAPRANIVSYSVCYPANYTAEYQGCPDEAILASIDDAIEDGVDAINFSIGGSEPYPWEDPTELAFLAARDAGINVAVAAGNSGYYSIGHTAPWTNVVAATIHGREVAVEGKSIEGMTGGDTPAPYTLNAQGISDGYTGSIVDAAAFGDGACLTPFPEGTFDGEIVVCARGDIARVAKAENVLAGGAGGFILYNTVSWGDNGEGDLFNDAYPLPGAHISQYDGYQLTTWLASGSDHMATITASTIDTPINEAIIDSIADFSSRGPSITHSHHFAPSIGAPGVDIFAPYADELPFVDNNGTQDWAFLSGTSMASPHVAGALALIQQAKPDWTPSEIQSAIQLTAMQAYTLPDWTGERTEANHYDSGSGIINVADALATGLIMDETVDGFIAANPRNGGDPRNLNLPQVLDMNCEQTCNWVRTVKATRDATWTVSAETGEYSVKLRAYPETFTLKAGEIQTILIQGEILDSQTRMGNSELEVHGELTLTPDNPDIPEVHMPAAMRFDHGDLPEAINIIAHRNDGKQTIGNLVTSPIADFTARVYAPVAATVETFTIPQDDDSYSPINDGLVEDSDHVIWLDVEEGSARLIAEITDHVSSTAKETYEEGVAGMLVGYDIDGDGEVDPQDEAICWSNAAWENNWCNINNPDAGKYWVLIHNFPNYFGDRPEDTYEVAYAVVSGEEVTSGLTATGPAATDGLTPFAFDVNWDMPELVKGDIYYSALDIGTDAGNAGNLGFIPVRLERGVNELSVAGSQTDARPGDIVSVELSVLANQTGSDRVFDINSMLPEHVSLIPNSVYVGSSYDYTVTETENGFSVAGTQLNSADWTREYVTTTNADDPFCRTPMFTGNEEGGYINLADFNIHPAEGSGGHYSENFVLPFNYLWYQAPDYALYNNYEYGATDFVEISPMGYVKLDSLPLFWPIHLPFPYLSFPDQMIGVMWKGDLFGDQILGTPYEYDMENQRYKGISIATLDDTLIVEWDGARTETYVGFDWETGENIFAANYADNYDFQLIMDVSEPGYAKGDFELIMAYDNVDFGSSNGQGSIGLQGYYGARGYFSPIYGYLGTQYAYDELQNSVESDLIVCYDYVGPESTQFDVSFMVRVNESAIGETVALEFNNVIEGMADASLTYEIGVASSINVGAINDQVVAEDSVLEGIMVAYSDSDAGANTITVTGENITAVVHGHEAGSMIDITPDADFSGETEVTVTVTDNLYTNDSASTSFMLTVTAMDDAPVAMASANGITEGESATLDASASYDMDGDDLTFTWSGPGSIADVNAVSTSVSGLTVGTHTFTLTVSDGVHESTSEVSVNVIAEPSDSDDSSGGGSTGPMLLLLALSMLVMRRRR